MPRRRDEGESCSLRVSGLANDDFLDPGRPAPWAFAARGGVARPPSPSCRPCREYSRRPRRCPGTTVRSRWRFVVQHSQLAVVHDLSPTAFNVRKASKACQERPAASLRAGSSRLERCSTDLPQVVESARRGVVRRHGGRGLGPPTCTTKSLHPTVTLGRFCWSNSLGLCDLTGEAAPVARSGGLTTGSDTVRPQGSDSFGRRPREVSGGARVAWPLRVMAGGRYGEWRRF